MIVEWTERKIEFEGNDTWKKQNQCVRGWNSEWFENGTNGKRNGRGTKTTRTESTGEWNVHKKL